MASTAMMPQSPYQPPEAKVEDRDDDASHSGSFLARCWRGKARSWQAFWLILVSGYVAINGVSFLLLRMTSPMSAQFAILAGITLLANLAYIVFALVSVWRCARNADYALLRLAARAVVMLLVALILYQFIEGIDKGRKMIHKGRSEVSGETAR